MLVSNKTFSLKKKEVEKKWILIDAEDMIVGRIASRIAILLKGKHKRYYTPSMDCGDYVVVVNASKIKFTGNKMQDKIYYRHTAYMGGLKQTTPAKLMERFPERILMMAVKRMLGSGPMSRKRIGHLFIYNSNEHKHQAQQPQMLDLVAMNSKNKIN